MTRPAPWILPLLQRLVGRIAAFDSLMSNLQDWQWKREAPRPPGPCRALLAIQQPLAARCADGQEKIYSSFGSADRPKAPDHVSFHVPHTYLASTLLLSNSIEAATSFRHVLLNG